MCVSTFGAKRFAPTHAAHAHVGRGIPTYHGNLYKALKLKAASLALRIWHSPQNPRNPFPNSPTTSPPVDTCTTFCLSRSLHLYLFVSTANALTGRPTMCECVGAWLEMLYNYTLRIFTMK